MAKFNVVQKQRRALKAQVKRDAHGDPLTKKLKIKQQPTYVSSKRKRKLMKKKRRVWFLFAFPCAYLCRIESICDVNWLFLFFASYLLQDEKEASQMGITSMEDVEMAVAEGNSFICLILSCFT